MDERKEFFRDLAALRARRGLSLAEIAERTQFPADTLAAVESGPEVPPLPALEAYLRGCGEPLATWEDRWRQLDQGTAAVVASDGDLPVREAGTSPLASAGAALAGAAAAGGAAYTIKRLGNGGSRKRLPGTSRPGAASWPAAASGRRVPALRYAAAASAAVLLAGGGVALLAWGHTAGHRGVAGAAPRSAGPRAAGVPTAGPPSAGGGARSAPAHGARPHRPSGSPGRPPRRCGKWRGSAVPSTASPLPTRRPAPGGPRRMAAGAAMAVTAAPCGPWTRTAISLSLRP